MTVFDPPNPYDLWAESMVTKSPGKMAQRLDDYGDGQVVVKDAIRRALAKAERCNICGKKLKDPVSIERGIGRECWRKS